MVHCVDPFKGEPVFGKIRYYRLHGRKGYRYQYTEEDFKSLRKFTVSAPRCYCMFNNVSMFDDARALQKRLKEETST